MVFSVWTDVELVAAVTAYRQMLSLETAGSPYNKAAVSRALLAGPLRGRSSVEQRMQNISHVLSTMSRPWIKGYKPLDHIGAESRDKIEAIIRSFDGPFGRPIPKLPPVAVSDTRKLPPTGYWIFVCNRKRWDGEAWLRSSCADLLYMVSGHNRDEVQCGDLGVLRLNALSRTRHREERPEGVYAIVEVIEGARERPDDDARFYEDPTDATAVVPRARLRILENLVSHPLSAQALPSDADFDHIRKPLMAATIPLSQAAFEAILEQSRTDLLNVNAARLAGDPIGVATIEQQAEHLDPQVRERLSRVIERGPVGDRVKAARRHKCQLCEAAGSHPHAFLKRDGSPYAEAHHVQPVSKLIPGSLGVQNIMVLCANHHRQAHYGSFDVVEETQNEWVLSVDGKKLTVERTALI